ncbi:MqnA/MqnD/SBP family protein [Thermodesulfitimonas autotrophica]|uniref:MqnA/MqnD/SBP family protein n=1 Tax=Thermodesulfitimonas autotrophica TaxID=1894989 RepID=UPI002FDF742E
MELTLAHSPDADDAFMFSALALGKIATEGYRFTHVLQDIESLNRAACEGVYDVSAISFHAYPYVAENYLLLPCGASVGDGYGPLVVVREDFPEGKEPAVVAVPGKLTTAYLTLKLWRPAWETVTMPFDAISPAVAFGAVEAGLLIHEGQLTYAREGLKKIVDLGAWWQEETGLPLPLGGNVIHRRHAARAALINGILREAIAWALAHREEALAHALTFARGLKQNEADRFVGMYVNKWTLDLGEVGRRAVAELLDRGYRAGLIEAPPQLTWVKE